MASISKKRKMASGSMLTLADLHIDILFHICSFLDRKTISLLAQACRTLKDKLYDRALWNNTVLALPEISKATTESLRLRGVRTVMLMPSSNNGILNQRSLVNILAIGTIETLIVHWMFIRFLRLPYPSVNFNRGFTNLKCIVLLAEEHDFRLGVGETFYQILRATKPRQLVIIQQSNMFTTPMRTFTQLGYLGMLQDLEFKPTNIDWSECSLSSRRYPDLMDLLDKLHTKSGCENLPLLKRLAGVHFDINSVSKIETFTQFFPNLKNLELEQSIFYSADLPVHSEEMGPNVAESIESLLIRMHPEVRNDIVSFISYLPGLKALNLCCAAPMLFRRKDDDLYIGQLAAGGLCKNLVVLNLFGNGKFENLPETGIRKAICWLNSLQVLILPKCSPSSYTDGLINDILANLKKLRSLLGIMGDDRIDSLPSLIYKTSDQSSKKILRKSSRSMWRPVREYSDDWCDAHGMKFFYPPESLRNLKLTHSTSVYTRYHCFKFGKKR